MNVQSLWRAEVGRPRVRELRTNVWMTICASIILSVSLLGQEREPNSNPSLGQQGVPTDVRPSTDTTNAETTASPSSNPAPNQDRSNAAFADKRGPARWKGWLDDRGFVLGISLKTDLSNNLRGGVSTKGAIFRDLLETNLSIDTEKALGWHGGKFFVSMQKHNGRNGSEFVGDAQIFSNIDDTTKTHLYEAWYEQNLASGRVRFKVGKVDANKEFAYVENASEFLNSSMGFSPTIFSFPTYPRPRMSANVFVSLSEHLYTSFGVYDALGGVMPIGEVGGKWGSKTLPGRMGFGLWKHMGDVECFDGTEKRSTSGMYLVLDQKLWREHPEAEDEQGIGMFFQYGSADPSVSDLALHTGAGVQWTGLLPRRDKDVLGLGATRVGFSDDADADFDETSETAWELFYKIQVRHWLSLAPDFQYIHNPSGVAARRHPVVGTMRMTIAF